MNRRDFVRSGAVALSAVAASPNQLVGEEQTARAAGREVHPLCTRWQYSPRLTPAMRAMDFDGGSAEAVVLPHTNKLLPWHSFDDEDFQFVSTYRRVVDLPETIAGKRVFVDFEGVMTASVVWWNGVRLGEYRGGYTPFSFEVTAHAKAGKNVLTVDVDSTERKDIPPFGNEVDYLTFGGIYREVFLRIVPEVFIENMHAITLDVLTARPKVGVQVHLDRPVGAAAHKLSLRAELRDGASVLAHASGEIALREAVRHHEQDADQAMGALVFDAARDEAAGTVVLENFSVPVSLWDLRSPKLYTVVVQLIDGERVIDENARRIGFREATFTEQGFSLNGKIVKLHGLDRHQTFPWVGQAMGARPQRQDAKILRHELNCNMVRTSHYPQSRHFLDACDEYGLLVLEEIPGWQHIGDRAWQDVSVDNVRRMVRRDWNHPSVVLWGVRINESPDDHDFYARTNALARALDPTRQTCGIRTSDNNRSEFLEDVFTFNDFGWPLRKPSHSRWLNTEFVGHTFPTKTIDAYERQREHVVRHARVHDTLASDPQYSGGLGWCAFDYNTHANFGSGDRICYHGVMDIFRTPKPAAGFYKSYVDPKDEVVLEPAFSWSRNDESVGITYAMINSNVEHIKMFTVSAAGETFAGEGGPDREQFAHLPYPPFCIHFVQHALQFPRWGDLRIEGYIGGKKVITKTLAGDGVDAKLAVLPDDTALRADGSDSVRIVLRMEDRFGNVRPYAADAVSITLDGPATLIGDNPIGLIGGRCAVWVRAKQQPGAVVFTATHARLGATSVRFTLEAHASETV